MTLTSHYKFFKKIEKLNKYFKLFEKGFLNFFFRIFENCVLNNLVLDTLPLPSYKNPCMP